MTLDDDLELLQVEFSRNSARFRTFGRLERLKRMKIDVYCQRRNCSPLNVVFSDYVDIARGLQSVSGYRPYNTRIGKQYGHRS